MSRTFDLTSIIPEPLTFRDVDGAVHEVRPAAALGAVDVARMNRLQHRVAAAQDHIATTDDDELERIAIEMESATDDLVALLIPSLAGERIKAIPLANKISLLTWWKDEQPAASGEAKAGRA